MSIRFIRAGMQTSVQDRGRTGLMRYGISRGGAADPMAMRLANLLLGNPVDTPVLEVTLAGPIIEFQCDIAIAIAGAEFELTLNERKVEGNKILQVKRGDTLGFGRLLSGARAYIAFSGQMDLPEVFDSCGTNLLGGFGGLHGRAIDKGDTIGFTQIRTAGTRRLPEAFQLRYSSHPQLRVVAGAEERLFGRQAASDFYSRAYQVLPQSNRMGIRLTGDTLDTEQVPQQVSSGLCPGTIQVPPDGLPIISFVEGQTIGGYPRIAHVISADLHMLGQLKANDRVSFLKITQEQARDVLAGKLQLLDKVRTHLDS